MYIKKLNPDILQALYNRGHTDMEIASMSAERAFSEYCNWNGLPGWGSKLLEVMNNINEASMNE